MATGQKRPPPTQRPPPPWPDPPHRLKHQNQFTATNHIGFGADHLAGNLPAVQRPQQQPPGPRQARWVGHRARIRLWLHRFFIVTHSPSRSNRRDGFGFLGKSEPGDKESAMALIRGRKRCELRIACHDYKRHGTTTLFAALEVATGKIIATHSRRRRRVEFLDFMDRVTSAFPDRQLHVILDNVNTHKKNEDWLKAHPNVHFHVRPTSASWLNQVEVWFSILQGKSLSGASFTSLKQLQEHIDAYINAYNEKAVPFVWTKKKVRQRRFKARRITQL